MRFEWPYMLLLALGPLGLLWWRLRTRPRGRGVSLGLPHVRQGLVEGGRVRFDQVVAERRRVPWRFWSAVLLLIVALARPQWGQADASASTGSREVIVALDVSLSMLATDVAPSRLERARLIAAKAAEDLPGHSFGLIGFAGSAHLLAPAAEERSLYRAFLRDLGPEHMLDPGSNFASLAEVAAAAFSPEASERLLLVLSDGEAEGGGWQERLADLRAKEIRVVTVGVGTAKGALVPGAGDRPLLDQSGKPVLSRLSPTILSEMASRTGGAYVELAEASRISNLLRSGGGVDSGAGAASAGTAKADRFTWFLLSALLLLAWSARAEWLARPKVRRLVSQPALAAALVLGFGLAAPAFQPLVAAAPDLHEEDDPLEAVKHTVSELLTKPALDAQDYFAFAEAATRYGEVQRGLAQPLSEGVLEDALAAIARGRRLDPAAADWDAMSAKLKRLLVPPPPIRDDGSGEPDPANERVDAQREVPVADPSTEGEPDGSEKRDDGAGNAESRSLQTVGGSRRDIYDQAEWQNDALAMPLYQLERLRGTGSPAELFRLMQARSGRRPAERGQVW